MNIIESDQMLHDATPGLGLQLSNIFAGRSNIFRGGGGGGGGVQLFPGMGV